MPITRGKDARGSFYRWGGLTKYYYKPNNKDSRELAKMKAQRQAGAVIARRSRSSRKRSSRK